MQILFQNGHIYLADYILLEGISRNGQGTSKARYITEPLVLFYVNKNDDLVPIAIQLSQTPSTGNPIWTPHDSVWINPHVQAGAPCVEGTRVPTQQLAGLLGLADMPDDDAIRRVCDDYRLTPAQVTSALEYELALAA